jgi:WD40 repeat protein
LASGITAQDDMRSKLRTFSLALTLTVIATVFLLLYLQDNSSHSNGSSSTPSPVGATASSPIQLRLLSSWQLTDTNVGVMKIAINPVQQQVAALTYSPELEIRVSDIGRGSLAVVFPKENNLHPSQIAYTPDGKFLVVGGGTDARSPISRVTVWDVSSGEIVASSPTIAGELWSISIAPDGTQVAISLQRRAINDALQISSNISTWTIGEAQWTQVLHETDGAIFSLAYSSNFAGFVYSVSKSRISGSITDMLTPQFAQQFSSETNWSSILKIWDNQNDQPELVDEISGEITALELSPASTYLAVANSDDSITLWDFRNLTRLAQTDAAVFSLSFSFDERTLAFYDEASRSLRFWDTHSASFIAAQSDHQDYIAAAHLPLFSPTRNLLVTARGGSSIVDIWEIIYPG